MRDVRFLLKRVLAFCLECCGVNAACRYLHRKQVKILLYHGIIAERLHGTLNAESLHIQRREFSQQMAYLTRRYHLLSLDEFVRRMRAHEALPAYTVVLTFDDGYLNNYQYAWPVLRQHQAPATFFVTTSFISSRDLLWLDRLEYFIHATQAPMLRIAVNGQALELPLAHQRAKVTALHRVKRLLKGMPEEQRMRMFRDIQEQLGVPYAYQEPYYCNPLTWDHLKEMCADQQIRIGSHAVQHVHLDTLERSVINEQMVESKQTLEEQLHTRIDHFAYPGGAFNNDIKGLLRDAGYLSGLTTRHGFNDTSTDLFALRRNEIGNLGDLWLFKATVSGALDGIKALLKRGR